MEITYVGRSKFLGDCEALIRQKQDSLAEGNAIRVFLAKGGYPGRVVVTIHADNQTFFSTDWEQADPTRFPARIKAAATALQKCGLTGAFLIIHRDGELEISPV